jgi:hypothetical protein
MKNTVNWNPKNKATLEQMWNDEKTDAEITAHFGCGAWAVAKQRSIMGLTAFKQKKGRIGAVKSPVTPNYDFNVLSYVKDGQHHMAVCKNKDAELAMIFAGKILNRFKEISEITILEPSVVLTRTKHLTIDRKG